MTDTPGQRGAEAEVRAEAYLSSQGLQACARNYRCKLGEIDLIMRDGDTLVFVEVRLRNNRRFANAWESVTTSKQRKLVRAAQMYLLQHRLTDKVCCRFDVLGIGPDGQCAWLRDAFGHAG